MSDDAAPKRLYTIFAVIVGGPLEDGARARVAAAMETPMTYHDAQAKARLNVASYRDKGFDVIGYGFEPTPDDDEEDTVDE